MLFFNYLAIKKKDKRVYNHVLGYLLSIKPQYLGLNFDEFDAHMQSYADALDKLLDEIITQINLPEILYYGMSTHLYQWVCASIVAEKIKSKNKESRIVIGGIGTKYAAIAFLENFDQFDFALWGEGENSLFTLTKELFNNPSITYKESDNNLLNTAYRLNDKIQTSRNKNQYVNISDTSLKADYSDYFEQKEVYEIFKKMKISIPIEGGRGCHWKRCHFCYLGSAESIQFPIIQ